MNRLSADLQNVITYIKFPFATTFSKTKMLIEQFFFKSLFKSINTMRLHIRFITCSDHVWLWMCLFAAKG